MKHEDKRADHQQSASPASSSAATRTLVVAAIGLALLDVILALPQRPDTASPPIAREIAVGTSCSEPQLPAEFRDMLGRD